MGSIALATRSKHTQSSAAPAAKSRAPSAQASRGATALQRRDEPGLLDRVGDGVSAVGDAVGEVAWSALEELAPQLVPLVRRVKSEGILGVLDGVIRDAIGGVFDGLDLDKEGPLALFERFKGVAAEAGRVIKAWTRPVRHAGGRAWTFVKDSLFGGEGRSRRLRGDRLGRPAHGTSRRLCA